MGTLGRGGAGARVSRTRRQVGARPDHLRAFLAEHGRVRQHPHDVDRYRRPAGASRLESCLGHGVEQLEDRGVFGSQSSQPGFEHGQIAQLALARHDGAQHQHGFLATQDRRGHLAVGSRTGQQHPAVDAERVPVRSGIGQRSDHGGHRVRHLPQRQPHESEQRHHAHRGRHRRAGGGPQHAQVVDHPLDAVSDAVGAFGLEAPDDAVADCGQVVAPRAPPRRRRLAHRAPERLDFLTFAAACLAIGQMDPHGEVLAQIELAIAVGRQVPSHRRARQGFHRALVSFKAARRAWRARVRRAFTVPSVTPSENAISS